MNKRGLEIIALLVFGAVLASGFALGANDTAVTNSGDAVAKAYGCLNSKIESSAGLSLQDAIFSSLAVGSNSKIDSAIAGEKAADNECWPAAGCKVKDTAQAAIVYSRLGKTTAGIKTYLDTRIGKASGLDWFVQIDIPGREQASCTLKVGDESRPVTIRKDQTIQGTLGKCFALGGSGYWLKVNPSCYEKDISISCDRDFVSSLLYQRSSGDVVFLTGEAHPSSASGITSEKVVSNCFLTSTKCDYEGTLWAAFAYKKMGNDVSGFMPYLLALAEDNVKYFPDAFLYMSTSGEGYYSAIVQSQKDGKYWEVTASSGKFYDTALAMMALGTTSAAELDNAKNYILGIQGKDGCFGSMSLRDLAFILYAGWPKSVAGGPTSCAGAGYSCEILSECTGAGGTEMAGYDCAGLVRMCCSVKVPKKSCDEQSGKICGMSEECTGTTSEASDGSCCLGTCGPRTTVNVCEQFGGTCRASCGSGEQESGESCPDSANVCCASGGSSGGGTNWILWIFVLGIMILLVIFGIMYKDKIRVWYYQAVGRLKSSTIFRRGGAPAGAVQRAPPRYPPSGYARPIQRPAVYQPRRAPSELDETLRKLKEMTK